MSENPEINRVYAERDQLVAALSKLFPASIENHTGEEFDSAWQNVIIIDLPTGQAAWHIHERELPWFAHLERGVRKWDGHSTEEKYRRIAALTALTATGAETRVCQHEWQSTVRYPKCMKCGVDEGDWRFDAKIRPLIEAIEQADHKSIKTVDQDGWISFYKFPCGPWHKILGLSRQLSPYRPEEPKPVVADVELRAYLISMVGLSAPPSQATDEDVADAILTELRRRGAWFPGDPVTAEMVDAGWAKWLHAPRDGHTDMMNVTITAALASRVK